MTPIRIYISVPADRDAVAMALFRNGYNVRQSRERSGKTYKWFVEYWRDDIGP